MTERDIRYHSSDDMTGPEFEGVAEPVAVVLRPDGSADVYGYVAVIDQAECDEEEYDHSRAKEDARNSWQH